jgi:putative transcriptional regulator
MNLDIDLFTIDKIHQKPQAGRVLISEPFLRDLYFKRTVVLLAEHNKDGTVGFVLNKPVDVPFSDVVKDFPDIEAGLFIGGPVSTNSLHYIHTIGEIIPQSVEVMKGIYWGGEFDVIKNMLKNRQIDQSQIRFFLGYSGWQPDQLEDELSENSWVVSELPTNIIMAQGEQDIWKEALSRVGGKYRLWKNFPENPNFN